MNLLPKGLFQPIPIEVERIAKIVPDTAFRVHTALGPGLLESAYRTAMQHVIETKGSLAETEVKLKMALDELLYELFRIKSN